MTKADKISQKFERALDYLNSAECELQGITELSSYDGERLNTKFLELIGLVEDCQYEVCAPLQMEEDERIAEIVSLEKRIAELKASL